MDLLTTEFILENLLEIVSNKICCIFFLGPFYDVGGEVCSHLSKFRLKIQNHIVNGHPIKRIYDSSCCHCIEFQRPFHLTEESKRNILYLLKNYDSDEFVEDALPNSLFKSFRLKPVVTANRFSIAPLRRNTFHSDNEYKILVPETWRLYPFKKKLLEEIRNNRILVVNGDASLEKSTAVPLTIVEESIEKESYCKVLCVESENLMAITNCSFIANHLRERIGSRVGFQVYLQSRVCDNTNIIYTTAVFFLRVLMGQDTNKDKNSFLYITHVIISDIHLHHAYKDILIKEIKNALPYYPHIKVILLSNSRDNKQFISYFGEGQDFSINIKLHTVNIYELEDIKELIKVNNSQTKPLLKFAFSPKKKNCTKLADEVLEYYYAKGTDIAFNNCMYLLSSKKMFVNYAHSKHGYTLLIASIKHDNPMHVGLLLSCENVNLFNQNKYKINALEYAISVNSYKCIKVLTSAVHFTNHELIPPLIDFDLIIQLLHLIMAYWKLENILVFLPSFDYLLKLQYRILKTQFLGNIHQDTRVHLLYENMQPEKLQHILLDKATSKIILATEFGECISHLNDITYVIDCCQVSREKYRPEFKCNEYINEWVSQESLKRRSLIASRFRDGYCFRMISRKLLNQLQLVCSPELNYIPINRIVLTVKLLRSSMITQYFEDTITKPPLQHIEDSIKFLKDIECFDSCLEVTWLGCRLIDVPLKLELGKSIVMSIVCKCLDPVLTIVSFLAHNINSKVIKKKAFDTYLNSFQGFDESYSDHLELLRLYQTWQDNIRTKIATDVISDEQTFILNGILENVCEMRTNLVGALRSSQLIHNQGPLSMHSINLKANNWAVIKAAITGGLYPKICMINLIDNNIKSRSSKLFLDASSNLHSTNIRALKSSPLSDWIVYFKETNRTTFNNISHCILVSSATVALFGGKTEMHPKNLLFTMDKVGYFIDENLCLITDIQTALLTFKLRQRFYAVYMDYLQSCTNTEKWRKSSEILHALDIISIVLLKEDRNAGFLQPNSVGNRPKAISNTLIKDLEFLSKSTNANLTNKANESRADHVNYDFLEKEFYLINIFDSHQSLKPFWKISKKNVLSDPYLKIICRMASKVKLIYVLVCSATQKRITDVGLLKYENGKFILKNCFQMNIPTHEVIIACANLKLKPPSFSPNLVPLKIDNEIGEIVLDLWQL